MMWGEHLNRRHWEYQKTSNDNNYCYLNTNRHCVKENNSYVQNLPVYNDHLAVNIVEVDSNKKHDFKNNEFKTTDSNTMLDHHYSGINSSLAAVAKPPPVSTSPCNNLYVNPPYFTVDKFVNMDQANHRDNRQIIQQPNRNHNHTSLNNHNSKEISNISVEYKIPENRESYLINNKNVIGIKVIENSHIPLMHFETSDRPAMATAATTPSTTVRVNVPMPMSIPKQYQDREQPIITEICNYGGDRDIVAYGNDTFPPKRKKSYSHIDFVQEPPPHHPNMKADYIRNHQLLSIHQYSGESIIKVESKNVYRVSSDLSATIESNPSQQHHHHHQHHRHREPNDYPYMEMQRNPPPPPPKPVCVQKPCMTSTKNIAREKRKPNYRELINSAHALRSSISENDLNMQIIKRTLNYKSLPTTTSPSSYNNFPPRIHQPPMVNKAAGETFCPKIEKPDVYDKSHSHSNHHYIQQPQLHHHQNECSVGSSKKPIPASPLDLSIKSVKAEADCGNKKVYEPLVVEKGRPPKFNFEPNFLDRRSFSQQPLNHQNSVIRFNYNSSKPPTEQKPILRAPKLELEAHFATRFEPDSNRKRMFAADSFDEDKFSIKKKCFEGSVGTPSFHKNAFAVDGDVEQKIDVQLPTTISTTTPPTPPLSSTSESEKIVEQIDQTIIKPEPEIEPEIEVKPELKIECETTELKTELQSEIKSSGSESESEVESQIESKLDISSSSFASRIRTKAELKGFVFQDQENVDLEASKNVELKSQLDLFDWNNTCEMFVDQLDRCFEKPVAKCSVENVQIDSDSESINRRSKPGPKRAVRKAKKEQTKLPTDDLVVEDSADKSLNESTETTASSEMNKSENTDLPASTDTENIPDVSPNDSVKDVNEESQSQSECSSINDQKRKIQEATRIFDLTKVSVVRLKREKYVSRMLRHSADEAPQQQEVNDTPKNESPPTEDSKSTVTPPSETQNVEQSTNSSSKFSRGRPPKKQSQVPLQKVPSLNTIKTRLRTQALEGKKDTPFKKKQKPKRRFENKSESDLPSNTDKIFLEVYRYKRALKVPPNLITIKNKCIQKMSKSIADSDLEPQFSEPTTPNRVVIESSSSASSSNKDNVPKSIIDVLHSRVVKAKHHQNQKFSKTDRPQTSSKPKLNTLTSSSTKSSNEHQQILNENNNNNNAPQEKRNVFETQVIPSRTRREHKMHLNKETIREVFRGDERPSSAPPQSINILEDIYDKSYNDQCIKYFQKLQKLSLCAERDLEKLNGQKGNANTNDNTTQQSSNKITSETKEEATTKVNEANNANDNQCNNSSNTNMIKRIRKRRVYKRRISSGFDYLRKKKRSNATTTCALRNYSRFKKRKTSTDECSPFRSESDILKEIQKWVLNKGVGQSALHKAATLGYIDVIVYCLEKMGLHPDHKDNAGYTPLHDACVNGSLDIARVLLQYGANHSESAHSGIRPIHEASENGHIEIVRMLLSYGADPLLETYSGQTPLMLASDPKISSLISMHLSDVQVSETNRNAWIFPGPWATNDEIENGCDVFSDIPSMDNVDKSLQSKLNFRRDFRYLQNNEWRTDNSEPLSTSDQSPSIKNMFRDFDIIYDAANADGELFEFEEADSPLPPLYLLKDEGMEKWVLLSDLCSLLKVKSKDTLLHKIFPSVSPSHVNRAFLKELKMCEFLERATCLQLLCAGEKINICHSKVVLIRYNENVRNLLGVKTIIMKL